MTAKELRDNIRDLIAGKALESSYSILDYIHTPDIQVTPCKVGDLCFEVIYKRGKKFSHILPERVLGFHIVDAESVRAVDPNYRKYRDRSSYIITWNSNTDKITHHNFNKIGKTIFFSYDEAEKSVDGPSILDAKETWL